MLVITRNNDNSQNCYGFDPEHARDAIGFYTKEYWTNQIQGFQAIFDDGETISVGAN